MADWETIKSRVYAADIICEPDGTIGGHARKIPGEQPDTRAKAVTVLGHVTRVGSRVEVGASESCALNVIRISPFVLR
jgi:hypothetical protein